MNGIMQEFIADEDFKKMIDLLSSPNCFTIMGTKSEKMHSNFIYWLLNPKSNHNLGSLSLELFFNLLKNRTNKQFNLESLKIKELEFSKEYEIGSHEGRLDIYAENEKMILVIENKIEASETYNRKLQKYQTNVYYDYYEKEAANKEKFYVYLRPFEGNMPYNQNFICITYQDLVDEVINECLHYPNLNIETRNVLEQYMTCLSLESNHIAYTMTDLAKKIYGKYKTAFDELRSTMANIERSEKVDLFFDKYKYYINEILGCNGIHPIIARTEKVPTGNEFVAMLCTDNVVNKDTELIATRKKYGITYVMQICFKNGKYMCYVGYLLYEDYSTQHIVPILDKNNEILFFESIDAAAREVELRAYTDVIKRAESGEKHAACDVPDKIPSGYGVPKGQWIVKNSEKRDANNKTLETLYSC